MLCIFVDLEKKKESVRSNYFFAKLLFNTARRGIQKLAPDVDYPPLVKYEDYWDLLWKYKVSRMLDKRDRRVLKRYISSLKRAVADTLKNDLPRLYLESDTPNLAGTFWRTVLKKTEKSLDENTLRQAKRILDRNPWIKFLIVYPTGPITGDESGNIRFHLFVLDKELIEKREVEKAVKEGLAHYLEIPHLVHFELKDVSELVEDDRKLGIILHPKASLLLDLVKKSGRTKPVEVVRALAELKDPHYLLSRIEDLPVTLLHPELISELKDLSPLELRKLLELLPEIKKVLEASGKEGTRKVLRALREDPSLLAFIFHPNLAKNADLLLEASRVHKGILNALKEVRKHVDGHDERSIAALLKTAIEAQNPQVIRLLAPHPDLVDHYRVLARFLGKVSEEDLSDLLEGKEKWKDIHPRYVEEALKHPLGKRVLLADLDTQDKIDLIKNIESLNERDILERELVKNFGVEKERAKLLVKYLGDKAKPFLEAHKDLLAVLNRRELLSALSYYKKKGKPLTNSEIRALYKLTRMSKEVQPSRIAEIVGKLDKDLLEELANISEGGLKGFFLATLSSPENLEEELTRFLRTRKEISARIKIPEEVEMEEEGEEIFKKFVKAVKDYNPVTKKIVLSEDLRRELGLREREIDRAKFFRLFKQKAISQGISKDRYRKMRRKLEAALEEGSREALEWLERKKVYHPVQEMTKEDIQRLNSFLNSLDKAISQKQIKVRGLSKDGSFIVFELVSESHESKALLDKDLRGFVSNLSKEKLRRRGKRVYVPREFFLNLANIGLGSHPLVEKVKEYVFSERPPHSSKGKRLSRRR